MIEISNLRTKKQGEWTKLVADIASDFQREDNNTEIWFAVRAENEDMLTTDVYNMFLLYPLYMAMYYKSDLCIHGNVSRKLYQNVNTYLQPIMCSFSDDLKKVNVIVDGFAEAEGPHNIVGTGLSGGVDCLSTIYTHYQVEQDPESKINALFITNFACDEDDDTRDLFHARSVDMKQIADALSLPLYELDTNLESFLHLDDRISYFSIFSCAFALEKVLKKYYISSSLSYAEILKWHNSSRNRDWSEYADSYAIPLMESQRMELVSDGCQYTRSEKTELISNWDVAQKYLYVCCSKKSVVNCCECTKCVRTLLALDAMGKLDSFSSVFDINKYKKHSFMDKCYMVLKRNYDCFAADNYNYFKQKGVELPSYFSARMRTLPAAIMRRLK